MVASAGGDAPDSRRDGGATLADAACLLTILWYKNKNAYF
jgi:hypothetical protein